MMQTDSMNQQFVAARALGYLQVAAGGVDTAATLKSLFSGGAFPAGTVYLLVKPFTQAMRYRDDGTAPTTTVGYPMAVGTEYRIDCQQLEQARIISSTAGGGLDILAYGR